MVRIVGRVAFSAVAAGAVAIWLAVVSGIGGAAAQVQFAGLTPGLVGLLQINIQLPATLPAGNNLPLAIAFGSSVAPTVNLAVR